MRENEQKARLEISSGKGTGLMLTAFLAGMGFIGNLTGEHSWSAVALLAIMVLSVGMYFEDRRKLQRAFDRDDAGSEIQ